MSGVTPNPKKRDYLLPPGCKDLIDVLKPRPERGSYSPGYGRETDTAAKASHHYRKDRMQGELADLEKYLTMVYESRATTFTLWISPADDETCIMIMRSGGGEEARVLAKVSVRMHSPRETAARAFFARHHLPTPDDTSLPEGFLPYLPVYIDFDILPVPSETRPLADFLADLLREVYGVSDESTLHFQIHEFTIRT